MIWNYIWYDIIWKLGCLKNGMFPLFGLLKDLLLYQLKSPKIYNILYLKHLFSRVPVWLKFGQLNFGKRTSISGSSNLQFEVAQSDSRNLFSSRPGFRVFAMGLLATSCNLFAKVLTPFSRFHMKTIRRTIKFILSRDKLGQGMRWFSLSLRLYGHIFISLGWFNLLAL